MALAIGTLTGDALLHLFPHALLADMGHHENHEAFHQKSVWKGFAAMVALLAFFLSEQLINMIGQLSHMQKYDYDLQLFNLQFDRKIIFYFKDMKKSVQIMTRLSRAFQFYAAHCACSDTR